MARMKKRRREDDELLDRSVHKKSGNQMGLIVAMAIDYEIVRHDDLSQIGLKTTFRRQ